MCPLLPGTRHLRGAASWLKDVVEVNVGGYFGIMEKKMETTIICGLYRGYIYIWVILGLYWDNGRENGNYLIGFKGVIGFRV